MIGMSEGGVAVGIGVVEKIDVNSIFVLLTASYMYILFLGVLLFSHPSPSV